MPRLLSPSLFVLAAAIAQPAIAAGGDLLVAPTRIILDGGRGTEVILNNKGTETSTYRISLQLMRMTPSGVLEEVVPGTETDKEKATQDMITYAPRRVTLAPNQPQVVRVGAHFADGLPDGEYRAHLLFRGLPDVTAVTTVQPRSGLSIALTPIYGVTIPVIVRKGALTASASISDVHLGVEDKAAAHLPISKPSVAPAPRTGDSGSALVFTLSRNGDRSVYGRIRVTKAGFAKPIYEARGLAVYAELSKRTVVLPLTPEVAVAMSGQVTVQYLEDNDAGGLIAETQAVLR